MTRIEVLQRLENIRTWANRALELLQKQPLTAPAQAEIQSIVRSLNDELRSEYRRLSVERVQRTMTMFELGVYSPTVRDALIHTGIDQLKTDTAPTQKWFEPLKAVVHSTNKHFR